MEISNLCKAWESKSLCCPEATWQRAAVVNVSFMEIRELGSTNMSATDALCDFGKATFPLSVCVPICTMRGLGSKGLAHLWFLSCSVA